MVGDKLKLFDCVVRKCALYEVVWVLGWVSMYACLCTSVLTENHSTFCAGKYWKNWDKIYWFINEFIYHWKTAEFHSKFLSYSFTVLLYNWISITFKYWKFINMTWKYLRSFDIFYLMCFDEMSWIIYVFVIDTHLFWSFFSILWYIFYFFNGCLSRLQVLIIRFYLS